MIGAFDAAAQIFDRQNVIVELSPEKENDFIKNKVTIRCEERLVLSMKQPLPPITGLAATLTNFTPWRGLRRGHPTVALFACYNSNSAAWEAAVLPLNYARKSMT
jgi:hypothetical protein